MIAQIIIFAVIAVASANLHVPLHHGEHHGPQPYKFGYSVKDHHGEQHREESGDGGHGVKGSYGFTDDRGVHRQVNYVADHAGFRAQVKTNEPGTANQNPAAVHIISNAHGHHLGGIANGYKGEGHHGLVGHAGYGYGGLGHAAGLGYGHGGHGYGGYGHGGHGYGGYGPVGLGYGGYGY